MSTATPSATLLPMAEEDLYALLAEDLLGPLRLELLGAQAEQRLRVTTLPAAVMTRLCAALQGDTRFVAKMLCAGEPTLPFEATAHKLIELRNGLREPLLVFLPPGQRTAAEDSLDIATFHELSVRTQGRELARRLLLRLPEALSAGLKEILQYLREQRLVRSVDQEIEYLLTIEKNGRSAQAVGGALPVFGLLPHLGLLAEKNVQHWLSRNAKAMEVLSDVRQPLQQRIGKLPLKPGSVQAALFAFLRSRHAEDARSWTREIAQNPQYQGLELGGWTFTDDGKQQELRLTLAELTLPMQQKDQVGETVSLPVLDLSKGTSLKVSFRSDPTPAEVPTWATFRISIYAHNHEEQEVAWESNDFPRPKGRNRLISRTLKADDLKDLEEGTYYLRVDAYDEAGAVLNRRRAADGSEEIGEDRAENESVVFLITRELAEVDPPESRAIPSSSLLDAWLLLHQRRSAKEKLGEGPPLLSKFLGAWQEPPAAPLRGNVHFELEGETLAGYVILMPAILRKLELTQLQEPEDLRPLQIDMSAGRRQVDILVKRSAAPGVADLAELAGDAGRDFLQARRTVFAALLSQHTLRAAGKEGGRVHREGVVETCDLGALSTEIEGYARSYAGLAEALLDQGTVAARRLLAQLDLTEVLWKRSPGDPGRALLLGPTHPVRLLWHLQHSALCEEWLRGLREGRLQVQEPRRFIEQLRRELLPLNLPLVLFDARERGYIEQAPLSTHWSLYLPDQTDRERPIDRALCRDRVRTLLGIKERNVVLPEAASQQVAGRILEYLQQHPYCDQLRINVFNAGDGELLVDVLRAVEKLRVDLCRPAPAPALRYALQLFGPPEHLDLLGQELESLLDPERQVGEDDEFTLLSKNHLLPKLVFARNTTEEFLRGSERFTAHVSLFLEQFVSRACVKRIDELRRSSFVRGLVQESETLQLGEGFVYGWSKGLRPVAAAGALPREVLLNQALHLAQRLQAAAATAGPAPVDEAPVVALQLDGPAQALLRRVHAISDWVLTVDKNLGLDFFDRPASQGELGYLLDFAPEYLQEDRYRLMLTTRSSLEVAAFIRPTQEEFGVAFEPGDEVLVMDALRSLSGRLALRLLSSETQAAEVFGLLLSRWLLQQAGYLRQRIIIPLDAHRSWFAPPEGDPQRSQRRADLLLLGIAPQARRVDIKIVEVKLRRDLTESGRSALYQSMRDQSENTERRLRELFDLHLFDPAGKQRGDAALRTKELASLLAFYARRAWRYRLLGDAELAATLAFAQDLDRGYALNLSSLGVVFQLRSQGSRTEEESGYSVLRFGADVAKRLFARARRSVDGSLSTNTQDSQPIAVDDEAVERLRTTIEGRPLRLVTPASAPPAPAEAPAPVMAPVRAAPPPVVARPVVLPPPPVVARPVVPPPPPLVVARPAVPPPPVVARPVPSPAAALPLPVVAAAAEPGPAADDLTDVLLGAAETTVQYGVLGTSAGVKVGLDLLGCNTISLFGVQGFGKSYTLGVIAEMASLPVRGINRLPAPLATVVFHYHKSDAYAPEYAQATLPNHKTREVERLLAEYSARPQGLRDVVLLTPEAKVEQRQREFPGLPVKAIKFSSAEVGADGWKFLLGAVGNESLYIKQMVAIMRRHRGRLTVTTLREELAKADLPDSTRRLAEDRVALAEQYIDDSASLAALLQPGRTVIIDLRDEWIEKEEALGLFVVMMRIFAGSRYQGQEFNKLMVLDEAHKYISESELIGQVVEIIREMRHQATSVLIASQDPLSVPRAVVELTSVLVLHRMTSPAWLKHLKGAIAALSEVTEAQLAALQPGEALVWAQRSTDRRFTQRPMKLVVRPRFTQHGGGTKTAVQGQTIK